MLARTQTNASVVQAGAASCRRRLDGGENRATKARRKRDRCEELSRIEIVLARPIDHAQLTMSPGVAVRYDLVDLPPLEGHFVALVAKAQD
jgi:hypothetical protein